MIPDSDQNTLHAIVQALPDPVFVIDEHGRYIDVLGGRGGGLDNPHDAFVGKHLHEVLPPEVADGLLASIRSTLERNAPRVEEYRLSSEAATIAPSNEEQWFQVRLAPLPDAPGQPRRVAWLSTDITERKQLEHQLEQAALTDALTETWNERHFMRILSQEITRQGRYKEPFCLLLLELEHAETVRAQFGADAADNCVREVARLIRLELRHSDVLGRLGPDRFGVILVNTPMNWSLEVGQRIAIRVSRMPFAVPGRTLHLSISGGLTDFRSGDNNAAMLQRAGQALKKSQAAGRDRVSVG
jgi:diguanylate cyclase (GGDEF)-like protein/PAS domain S-box-containing protein